MYTLTDFDYHLPPENIAHAAAEPRDSARLLLWPERKEQVFRDLPGLLNPGDVLVVNDSKVIPARLYGVRPAREVGGGHDVEVEILLHQALAADLTRWRVFAKPGRRLRAGDVIRLPGDASAILEEAGAQPVLRLELPPEDVPAYLEAHGHTPLPPYIHAEDTPDVRARYQTVYADPQKPGSVAAPTAGLHFTPEVFAALAKKGVEVRRVTLHVGAGTFLNPTPEQLAERRLHAETAHVPSETAAAVLAAKARGSAVIPVGTTALRTLESWAAYGNMAPEGWTGSTTLFIQPGYAFKVADRLLTNFHLPQSSLLMLVAAFIGHGAMREMYSHAIRTGFRFYSFGDTSLLTKAP